MPFISFSGLIALARTSNTMLNRSGDSGHSFLIPVWKAVSSSLSSMMLAVGFTYISFIMLRQFSSILNLLSVFIVKYCWICQILFLWQVDDHVVFPLYLINVMWDNFHTLNEPCIPGINPTWTWCLVLLVCSWILSASILLRIFESVFIRNIGLYFLFCIFFWLSIKTNELVFSFKLLEIFDKDWC